jgi:hypothetical protein
MQTKKAQLAPAAKLLFTIAVSAVFFVGNAHAKVPHRLAPKSGSVPDFDLKRVCQKQNISFGTVDDCIMQENEARKMLTEKWSSFSASDKSSCYGDMKEVIQSSSYIYFVNCLMEKQENRRPVPQASAESARVSAQLQRHRRN